MFKKGSDMLKKFNFFPNESRTALMVFVNDNGFASTSICLNPAKCSDKGFRPQEAV